MYNELTEIDIQKMKEELDRALIEKQEKEREFEACDKEYSIIHTEFERKYQKTVYFYAFL